MICVILEHDPNYIYLVASIRQALFASLDLFRRLALETAGRLNYVYPVQADRHGSAWLSELLRH